MSEMWFKPPLRVPYISEHPKNPTNKQKDFFDVEIHKIQAKQIQNARYQRLCKQESG